MDTALRDRLVAAERRIALLTQQIANLPVRYASGGEGGDPLHPQIALITGVPVVGASPHYSTTFDLTFKIPANLSALTIVRAVLLDVANVDGDAILDIYNPNALTLAELTFSAIDVRKEGTPKVGDVVRVWTSDGEHVQHGEDAWDDVTGEQNVDFHAIYCDVLNPTDYLRGLATWALGTGQVLTHDAADPDIKWGTRQDVGEVPPWVFVYPDDPIPGAGGDTVAEGYCIEIVDAAGVKTVHHDAITAAAGTQAAGIAAGAYQIWIHGEGATVRTDAKWTTATGFDPAETMLHGLINGVWHVKTIAGWLNLLGGYVFGNIQTIGHLANGVTEWKTLVTKVVNNPTAIELNLITSDTFLESKLLYTPVTFTFWSGAVDGTAANFNDTVAIDPC